MEPVLDLHFGIVNVGIHFVRVKRRPFGWCRRSTCQVCHQALESRTVYV